LVVDWQEGVSGNGGESSKITVARRKMNKKPIFERFEGRWGGEQIRKEGKETRSTHKITFSVKTSGT